MNGNGFPNWIKIVAQVGFPIGAAIYLAVILYPLVNDTNAMIEEHIKTLVRPLQQIDEQTRLLKAICRNVAVSEFEKANCDVSSLTNK